MTALSSTSAGIAPPLSQEIGPDAVVTFRVHVGQTAQVGAQVGIKSGLSQDQVEILRLSRQERTLVELMNAGERRNRTKFRPGKPRSRMQRYRTTEAGLAMATGHASGRPPVSGPLAPNSGRKGGQSRTKRRKGLQ